MQNFGRGIEIERKFVIRMPDVELLRAHIGHIELEIEQIYLPTIGGVTHRIRRAKSGGVLRYYETKKTRIDKMSVVEEEREISADEYSALAEEIDSETSPIYKTRHKLPFGGRILEIDIYDKWKTSAVLECELPTRECEVPLPDFIEIIKEVTGEREYSNAAMAKIFPPELK